jgi:hypothetical protein
MHFGIDVFKPMYRLFSDNRAFSLYQRLLK